MSLPVEPLKEAFKGTPSKVRPAFSVVDWDGDGDWDWLLQDDEGLWFLEFSAGHPGFNMKA